MSRFSFSVAFCFLLTFITFANTAPEVTNVTYSQRTDGSKKVDIRYDLSDPDGDKCTISILVSSDSGSTWTVSATSLTGAIGANITPDKGKQVTWDCTKDISGTFGANYRIKVIANDNSIPADMVIIPAGTFQMGNSKSPDEGQSDELPVHTVTLNSFAMGKYEITNGQYCAFLNGAYPSQLKAYIDRVYATSDTYHDFQYCDTSIDSRSQIAFSNNIFTVRTKGGRDMTNDPMYRVTWYGAAAYCNWRSQQEGKQMCYNLSTWECDFSKKGYRLPTEAEWEYAARGGQTGNRFPWGDTISHSQANYAASQSLYNYEDSPTHGLHPKWNDGIVPYTSPVGSFPANGYGLFDMAGNGWEWCNDWFSETYYSISPEKNPTGPATDRFRVLRGGNCSQTAHRCRVSSRSHEYLYYPYAVRGFDGNFGFRVVLIF